MAMPSRRLRIADGVGGHHQGNTVTGMEKASSLVDSDPGFPKSSAAKACVILPARLIGNHSSHNMNRHAFTSAGIAP